MKALLKKAVKRHSKILSIIKNRILKNVQVTHRKARKLGKRYDKQRAKNFKVPTHVYVKISTHSYLAMIILYFVCSDAF